MECQCSCAVTPKTKRTPRTAASLPFGPNCISVMTSSTETRSRMSNATWYLNASAAGSRLATRTVRPLAAQCSCSAWQ